MGRPAAVRAAGVHLTKAHRLELAAERKWRWRWRSASFAIRFGRNPSARNRGVATKPAYEAIINNLVLRGLKNCSAIGS